MSASVPWRRDEHIIKCGKCNAPVIEGQCGCRQGAGMNAPFDIDRLISDAALRPYVSFTVWLGLGVLLLGIVAVLS